MSNIIILIGICLFFYAADYLTAIKFSKVNFKAFRQYETNKSLVWYLEQFSITKNRMFLFVSKISPLINIILATTLMGAVGYYRFNLNFYIGVRMFLAVQILASVVGMVSNLIAINKFKEVKENK